ncbi:MAG: tRNA (N(6)-L-threonylcarbamoyladenosine(37)-C(2))-methylthiotransferase MtaB [Candidatus Omnitrophica bacterium]|nr:tRNA (N(6)-L-threonylcarbamoyladenosine(37)-C(2))-methylthiotransferase MtaB [Candidatus Omnitrophota bacterium]
MSDRPVKFFQLITFGCRVNQYETQAIREQLLEAGYQERTPDSPEADLVVINSCTVTQAADNECMCAIRNLHKQRPATQILVTGCLVQRDADLLKGLPGVKVLAGTGQKHRIAELVREIDPWAAEPRLELELTRVYSPLTISSFEGRSKAFLKVQDGCDRSCAFCKIPLVRGRSRSRGMKEILDEARRLLEAGYRELTVAGVAVGLWGREWEIGASLGDLMEEIDRLPGSFRVRLSSLDPRDLDDRLIDALKNSSKICHHLHLSLQSGSDAVLARMNRGYTTGDYRRQVDRVREFWPDLGLTTDLIVGFPGESRREFEETLAFCGEIRFLKVHVFPYSRRGGTSASFFKNHVPRDEIKRRAAVLRQTAAETAGRFRAGFIGSEQQVLVEENGSGFTSQFIRVRFEAFPDEAGRLLPIMITGATDEVLLGTVVRPTPFLTGPLDNLAKDVPSLR